MKTIKQGSKKAWWVGERITCEYCGFVGELEEVDAQSPYWENPPLSARKELAVGLMCPCCSRTMFLQKSQVLLREMKPVLEIETYERMPMPLDKSSIVNRHKESSPHEQTQTD